MNSRNFEKVERFPLSVREITQEDYHKSELLTPPFRCVPFVNLGLYLGLDRSSGGDTNASSPARTVSARAHELLATAPSWMQSRLLSMYIAHHRESLSSLKIPYYLPESFGGAGLPIIEGTDHIPSNSDLRIARVIHERMLPHIRPPVRPNDTEWKTWQIAAQLCKQRGINLSEDTIKWQQDNLGEWRGDSISVMSLMNLLVVEAFLQAKNLRQLKKQVAVNRLKSDVLSAYYHRLSIFINKIRSNRDVPLETVRAYEIGCLPNVELTNRNSPTFPSSFCRPLVL